MSIFDILIIVDTALIAFLVFFRKDIGGKHIDEQFDRLEKNQERTERMVREDVAQNREELSKTLNQFSETFSKQISSMAQGNEARLEKMRDVVEARLKELQADNSQKLEQMRVTVDEKLHNTLERRLGDSFKLVSERLEKVHQGLGEMQNLASGVGDLKRVLLNVKTKGIWGEIQLGNLLEQTLSPDQYEKNVRTKSGSNDAVEFAVKLPGRSGSDIVYLPIDSKFPTEDFERLLDAQDKADVVAMVESQKALEARIKMEAKKIKDKYIDPPHTTDFAIMFLPTEGLYAEVLRHPGLFDHLQREQRVTLAGPTTITAILNSLHMGFRTLEVEKRASEVWQVLGTVKTEFHKFGEILESTQKKIESAQKELESATRKTRTIEKKLDKVQGITVSETEILPNLEEHE
ncbi:MAG: DNA recombination protein RmuC [Candidatus Omnitrophica bacterium]|nr:DNA recombination protein RmuC [Candidatus Omnitrophota bacterium]